MLYFNTHQSKCRMSHVTPQSSHVTRHTSHVTRHTSHVTHHTSHVTRHTSHVTRHTSHVTRHTSPALGHRRAQRCRCGFSSSFSFLAAFAPTLNNACVLFRLSRAHQANCYGKEHFHVMETSHVTRHTSHVTRHTSHVTRHTSHVTRHTSHVHQVHRKGRRRFSSSKDL